MMPARLLLPLLLVTLLSARAAAFDHAQTQGKAELDIRSPSPGPRLALSDTLTVTVSVHGSEPEVEPLPGLPAGTPWTVLRRGKPKRIIDDGRRWLQTFELAPLTTGKLVLDFPSLRYRAAGQEWQTAKWQPVEIEVVSEIKDPDAAKLRDIPSVEEPPTAPPADPLWWPLLLPLPLLVLAAWLIRRGLAAPAPALRRTDDALRRWQRLVARGLPERGEGAAFVTLLGRLLRRDLERELQIPARQRTTPEVIATIASSSSLTDDQKRFLTSFLERCELLAYSGCRPDPAECKALAAAVRDFLGSRDSASGRR